MTPYLLRLVPALLLPVGAVVHAADPASPASAGNLLQALLGLTVVLGLMAGAVWLLRRFGLAQPASAGAVKLVGGLNVGHRERILVVEVADQWIVVGVAPGRVSSLATMAKQESTALAAPAPTSKSFSAWLQQTIEKRNGR
ncbi:MAG TPA: flagellar biosynthetic protein FliO [Noviherbaspirillum sp.]|nr:flagellar biosynthetic protein FliO [Noviherbaspirillum sp.]